MSGGSRAKGTDAARQQAILARVQREGFAAIDVLAQAFEVTPQTIRRDINRLAADGQVRRYHGGAGLPSSIENIAYPARQVLHRAEKEAIARLAARQVPDGASLFINIGTTTEEIAKALLDHRQLRVITNNLNVAALLADKPDFEVIVAGGQVRTRDKGIVGEATLDLVRQFKVDMGVIGISGIDEDGALLDYDYREVRVTQAIIAHSRRVLLAADHSKFGRAAMVRVAEIGAVDLLCTDRLPPEPLVRMLREGGGQLLIAEQAATE